MLCVKLWHPNRYSLKALGIYSALFGKFLAHINRAKSLLIGVLNLSWGNRDIEPLSLHMKNVMFLNCTVWRTVFLDKTLNFWCLTLGKMYGIIIPGLALEGSSIPRPYAWGCIVGKKKMIKKIITACNDQSVLQIFSACSENDGVEYFLCNVIRSLIWEKIVHFTCITKGWCVFCPCWCAVVFSAQLLVFCDSFLMKLGLGAAVPSISFIFLLAACVGMNSNPKILKEISRAPQKHCLPPWGKAIPPLVKLHYSCYYIKKKLLCWEK